MECSNTDAYRAERERVEALISRVDRVETAL